jgi:hypothetical protein
VVGSKPYEYAKTLTLRSASASSAGHVHRRARGPVEAGDAALPRALDQLGEALRAHHALDVLEGQRGDVVQRAHVCVALAPVRGQHELVHRGHARYAVQDREPAPDHLVQEPDREPGGDLVDPELDHVRGARPERDRRVPPVVELLQHPALVVGQRMAASGAPGADERHSSSRYRDLSFAKSSS